MRTHASWLADTINPARRADMMAPLLAGSMHGRRIAVASAEPEDAHLTGMTRSLDRRLLALNLRPVASSVASTRKVA